MDIGIAHNQVLMAKQSRDREEEARALKALTVILANHRGPIDELLERNS